MILRSLRSLRMTKSEELRMTQIEGLAMTGQILADYVISLDMSF